MPKSRLPTSRVQPSHEGSPSTIKTVTVLREVELNGTVLANAPRVLVNRYRRMKFAAQVAENQRTESPRSHNGPGPANSLQVLERLLTEPRMGIVWDRVETVLLAEREPHNGDGLESKSDAFLEGFPGVESNKHEGQPYEQLWSAIYYAWARHKEPVVPRRELRRSIGQLTKALEALGHAIDPRKAAVPPWLLYECLPDDLAEMLDGDIFAPRLARVAREANEKARTVLARTRPVDRSGYPWGIFVRLLDTHWPFSLKVLCTHDTLAQIAMAVLPDQSLPPRQPLTSRQVRDTLRPSQSRRSH